MGKSHASFHKHVINIRKFVDSDLCCLSYFIGLFNAFDENRDNHIDFKEISCGLSACCRGPLAERQKCECIKHCHKICK